MSLCQGREMLLQETAEFASGRLDQIGLPSDPPSVSVTDGQKRGNEWNYHKSEMWAQDRQRRAKPRESSFGGMITSTESPLRHDITTLVTNFENMVSSGTPQRGPLGY